MIFKKTEIEENNVGWLMTFGDMMTLILTFFVLLFQKATPPQKMIFMFFLKILIQITPIETENSRIDAQIRAIAASEPLMKSIASPEKPGSVSELGP